ncbi:hypothetical protein V1638_04170 [Pseudarthrobacter sp. J64]|uniref:hypothetical protein n=1 Tax=Pseudarthrobacter sp. J64 TaxID=3116485 RepID=UPI002E804872|nr:hypothetical protein [Pseudarthrobacter sp. J64]MEE2568592.1 hypothetical protein [Pseudarthrobacter sp. J64]
MMKPRERYKRDAVALLQKRHGPADYVPVDFGSGPIDIIRGNGDDLSQEEAATLAQFRYGFRLFGADV